MNLRWLIQVSLMAIASIMQLVFPFNRNLEIVPAISVCNLSVDYQDTSSYAYPCLPAWQASEDRARFLLRPTIYSNLYAGSNLELLNTHPKDRQLFVLEIADLSAGAQILDCGCPWLSFYATARAIGVFGDDGFTSSTNFRPIKVGLGRTEVSWNFELQQQPFWVRELWTRINTVNNSALFQIGYFPYRLGNGIIVGNAHKIVTPIIGLYNYEYYINQYRPGALISIGQAPIYIDAYAGIIATASTSWYKASSFGRANELTLNNCPYIGPNSTNVVGMLKGSWIPVQGVSVELAAIGLHEGIQQVESPFDAKMDVGTLALVIDVDQEPFACHLEMAGQRGSQKVAAIDRNIYIHLGGIQQDHLFFNVSTTPGAVLWRGSEVQPFPEILGRNKDECAEFFNGWPIPNSLPLLRNSCNRFRNAYTNCIESFYFLVEGAWRPLTAESISAYIAGTFIYASGGKAPNDSPEKILVNRMNPDQTIYLDCNKNTNSFIGVEQMYQSKLVTSLFAMQAERLQETYTIDPLRLTRAIYSNRITAGGCLTLEGDNGHSTWKIQGNFFSYWQAGQITKGYNYPVSVLYQMNADLLSATNAYLATITADAAIIPGKHLGDEFNINWTYSYKNLCSIYALFGMFLPGSYYQDIAGKYIPLTAQQQQGAPDFTGIEVFSQKYTIQTGCKNALLAMVGISVSFDLVLDTMQLFKNYLTGTDAIVPRHR